jgi:ABC-type branched-subunit amino acid transport system ATPase component
VCSSDLVDYNYVLTKGRIVWDGDCQAMRKEPDFAQKYLGV